MNYCELLNQEIQRWIQIIEMCNSPEKLDEIKRQCTENLNNLQEEQQNNCT